MSDLSKRLWAWAADPLIRGSLEADLLAAAEALEAAEWRSIESAPKGCVTEDAGCRGETEWFLGLSKFGDVRSIKRLPDSFGYTWCDYDNTYYSADYFTDWMPLPE